MHWQVGVELFPSPFAICAVIGRFRVVNVGTAGTQRCGHVDQGVHSEVESKRS